MFVGLFVCLLDSWLVCAFLVPRVFWFVSSFVNLLDCSFTFPYLHWFMYRCAGSVVGYLFNASFLHLRVSWQRMFVCLVVSLFINASCVHVFAYLRIHLCHLISVSAYLQLFGLVVLCLFVILILLISVYVFTWLLCYELGFHGCAYIYLWISVFVDLFVVYVFLSSLLYCLCFRCLFICTFNVLLVYSNLCAY